MLTRKEMEERIFNQLNKIEQLKKDKNKLQETLEQTIRELNRANTKIKKLEDNIKKYEAIIKTQIELGIELEEKIRRLEKGE